MREKENNTPITDVIWIIWEQKAWLERLVFRRRPLTFKLEGELIGVVEGEHLLVRRLLVGVEDELGGEHEHGKASLHQLGLSMLLLLHWPRLSSSPSPASRRPPTPLPTSYRAASSTPLRWETPLPALIASGPCFCEERQAGGNKRPWNATSYLRFENAEGYVLIAMYLFICMCVTRITQKVLNQIA